MVMTVARLVVSMLAMAPFFVGGQVTIGVNVTTAQLAPSMTTADGKVDPPSTSAAAATPSTITSTTTDGKVDPPTTTTAAATPSTITSTTTSFTMLPASSTLPVSLAASTDASTSTVSVQTFTPVVSSSTTSSMASSSQSATSRPKAAASAANLPTSLEFNDPTYARTVAAVVGGCGLFILNTVFFVIVSLMLRYTVRMERHRMPKVPRKSLTGGGGLFYGGNEVQSNQALFAPSLSATNIVGGASDIQLDTRGGGRGIYHNRAFDSEPTGSTQATISADDGYKPIEIKSQAGNSSRA